MIRHGVMGRVWPAVFFVVFVMVTCKVCVCVCVCDLCVCVCDCVCVCACASAFCLNKTSLLDCALKTKDLLFGDYRGNHWYVCYREHFVCFLVVFHDLFPFRFVRFLLWTSSFHFFSFYLVP